MSASGLWVKKIIPDQKKKKYILYEKNRKEGGKEGRKEGGKEGEREGGKEGGREYHIIIFTYLHKNVIHINVFMLTHCTYF